MFLSLLQTIQEMDMAVLEFLADQFHGGWLDGCMKFITSLGNAGFLWIVLSVTLLCFRRTRECGIVMAASLIISAVLREGLLKYWIQRPRPFVENPAIVLMIPPPAGVYSFPSGHTASSFAAAAALWKRDRRWGTAAFLLAALIGFSRIYLQVHYPSDVIAGMALGLICGFGVQKLWKKYRSRFVRTGESA